MEDEKSRRQSIAANKQAKAQRALNAAIESHDIDLLKKAIPQATSAGVSGDGLETAQRVLDFEVNKELFQDLINVRKAVDSLTQTVQKVEKQVKAVSGGMAVDGSISAEAWATSIVEMVEVKLWASVEKRVEDKIREAVANATQEITTSAKELAGLLKDVKVDSQPGGRNGDLGLDSSSDEDSDDLFSKGKGKGKEGKGKSPTHRSKKKHNTALLGITNKEEKLEAYDDGSHSHHLLTNHLPHRNNERRPSGLLAERPSFSNSRVGESYGLKQGSAHKKMPTNEVAEEKEEEKPERKKAEPSWLEPNFTAKPRDIKNILAGKSCTGLAEVDKLLQRVPIMLKEPQNWGLRVKDVRNFFEYIQEDLFKYCKTSDDFNENLHVVTPRYIKPWTKDYAPYSLAGVINADRLTTLKINSLEEIMKANIFISHCWNENFGDFVSTMYSILSPDDTVWVCALSICQNVDIQEILGERIEDSPFWRAMPHCRRVTMLIDRKAEPFERAWCALEEYLATYKLRLPFSICMPNNMDEEAWVEVDRKLQNFSIRECKASEESDKRKIMEIIGDKADIIDRVVRDESQKACFAARVMSVAHNGTIKDLFPLAMQALAQITSGSGRSILHHCAMEGKVEQLQGLIEYDLMLDGRDQAGKAPLHFAAELGQVEVADILIKGQANVNLTDNFGWTPLSFAANKQQATIVPLLVEGKANINAPDSDGFTPLLSAAVEGGADVARELIRLGASLEVKDSYGHSALTLACQANFIDVVECLIEAKCALDETDSDGCTPLMYAAGFGYTQVVKALVNGKADTQVQDAQEYKAIDFATDSHHQEIIAILEKFEPPATPASPRP